MMVGRGDWSPDQGESTGMTARATGGHADAEMAAMPLVFMYHSVSPYDEDPHEVTLTPDRFDKHMRWLRSRGLRGVSMAELLSAEARGEGRGLVGLTFDDGYQDFMTYAVPVMQRYGFTATCFVLGNLLGARDDWNRPAPEKALMTADEVRSAVHHGMEIGSHGLNHVVLTDTDDQTLTAEAAHSREILEQVIGRKVLGFCYPFGRQDPRVVEAVRRAGYDYACAIWPSPAIGRHAIPRTYVHDRDTSWRLDAKRVVACIRVGNRLAVRHHRSGT